MKNSKISTTDKRSKAIHKSREKLLFVFLGITILCSLVVSSIALNLHTSYQDQLNRASAETEQLFLSSKKIPGVSCAVLNYEKVKSLIGSNVKRSSSNLLVPLIREDGDNWFHNDSCRYVLNDDESKYLELFIMTFSNEELARDQYEKRLPIVNELQLLDAIEYSADVVQYDAGVHYVLQGRQIIEVAGSDGTPSNQQRFSERVLKEVLLAIPPLE